MTDTDRLLDPATRLARALGAHDAASHGVVPGIHPATTFLRGGDLTYPAGYSYARPFNPTFDPAERLLADLEGAAEALLFASGMTAATTLFQTLSPGDHVVAPKVMYWGLRHWLRAHAAQWGWSVDFVDMTDTGATAAAIRPGKTRIVWAETPANPTWDVTDLAATARLAREAGALFAVDNTVPTPLLTRPIDFGADVVMHSATKYLNGHSDVLMGVLAVRDTALPAWERVRAIRAAQGGMPGPFEAWLLLRGMRTLAVRLERGCANAMAIARHFAADPRVTVLYPGLPGHPGHGIAARQMTGGFGAMLSLRINAGAQAAIDTAARLKVWTRATSIGGVESLVEHRASVEGPDSPCPPDMLRLSCGIEAADDLIDDLDRALP